MVPHPSSGISDETSSLLHSCNGDMGSPPPNDIENGYGTPQRKNKVERSATPETVTLSTYEVSNDDDETHDNETINKRHLWLLPFFVNIFLACASFSIVMPSLAPYILDIGAPLAFLPWVVSSYSVGEMFGSVAIGHYYEHATKTYKTLGRGPKLSMMICIQMHTQPLVNTIQINRTLNL